MRLAWERNTTVSTMRCHKLVAEPLLRIFQATLDHYGMEKIRELGLDLYGGCFNNRSIIGGKATSMHAWGIAVDHGPGQERPEHPCTESGTVRTGVRGLLAVRGGGGGRIPGTRTRLRLDALPVRYSLTGADGSVRQPSSQRRRRAAQSSPSPPCPQEGAFFQFTEVFSGQMEQLPPVIGVLVAHAVEEGRPLPAAHAQVVLERIHQLRRAVGGDGVVVTRAFMEAVDFLRKAPGRPFSGFPCRC